MLMEKTTQPKPQTCDFVDVLIDVVLEMGEMGVPSEQQSSTQLLVPGLFSEQSTGYVITFGYPGTPRLPDALAAAGDQFAHLKRDVDQFIDKVTSMVFRLGRLFHEHVMKISPGSIVKTGSRIGTHDCPTPPGYSGGPVSPIGAPGVRRAFLSAIALMVVLSSGSRSSSSMPSGIM
ncbi:hypothetical protein HKX48_000558 [Thoreauomyces humboldtii]|nr:hypothetical protein HKX48_000558 [Thoreauomyces humboldtii]